MNKSETNIIEINELQYIKGVGPNRAEAFEKEGIKNRTDLALYFPRAYIDRNSADSLEQIKKNLMQENFFETEKFFSFAFNKEVTLVCKIVSKHTNIIRGSRKMLLITISDNSRNFGKIIFWNRAEYFDKAYSIGQILAVSGKPELNARDEVTFSHPEIDIIEEDDIDEYKSGVIIPKYKLTEDMRRAGISLPIIRKILRNTLEKGNFCIEETLDEEYLKQLNLPNIHESIRALHFPSSKAQLELARYRIKFEELLYYQLSISLRKQHLLKNERGIVISKKSNLARKLYYALPFKLTGAQKQVLREIDSDFKSGRNMNRLLQGDVGSGKTIVAILAMLMAIDSGIQVCFMAPTELLAEQHYHTLNKFLQEKFNDNIKIVQLIGGQKIKHRRELIEKIASGEANIIVGTHALFQNDIAYNNLGFVIIDEQHRFGVAQRADLIAMARSSFEDKTLSPHILVMTATPIPRTLTMTVYGDLDVSIINELPKNRKPIKTKVQFDSKRAEIYNFIRSEISAGRQAYIVFPLVEKSEKLELKAATVQYEVIDNEVFPEFTCGLLHGQMFWYEKEETMQAFLKREYQVLVATTVIEVGIDVPNATVMLIENAERFGLSQLHQLRGRVGRGAEQSYCILMTKDNFKYKMKSGIIEDERIAAIIRLKTMEQTTCGFEISEVDLKLRGPGDMLGKRQAGLPDFKYANIVEDKDIVITSKRFAESIIQFDPTLTKTTNSKLRKTLEKRFNLDNSYFGIA